MVTIRTPKSKRITVKDLNSFRFLKIPKELIFNLEQYRPSTSKAVTRGKAAIK